MRTFLACVLTSVLAGILASCGDATIAPKRSSKAAQYNAHWYEKLEEETTWHLARKRCEELGGHLVCITSPEEDAFVRGLSKDESVWIGASDEAKEGEWCWVSGEPFGYKNWHGNEPDNHMGVQHHALYWVGRGWADDFAGMRIKYICEWDR